MTPRALLVRQLQAFFEAHLIGLYRWSSAGEADELPPPGTARLRPPEKRPKERGRRQQDKEVVGVDFDSYSLVISSPDEAPPLGKIIVFHPELGSLEGPIDAETWIRVRDFITKKKGNEDVHHRYEHA